MTDRPTLNRNAPRTEEEDVPRYYHNHDVPHVLARVRFMDRFFNDVIDHDEQVREHYSQLHEAYLTMTAQELRPYALDLALSLIALEDEVAKSDTGEPAK
jgi:hypothetical protein